MKIIAADFGKNSAYVYNYHTKKGQKFKSINNVLNHLSCQDGYTIALEYAHGGCPLTDKSKAQLFNNEQLLKFYSESKENNNIIKLFPQFQSPRVLNMAKNAGIIRGKKSEENDAKALAWFVAEVNDIPLMNPPTGFEMNSMRKFACEVKDTSNTTLNLMRRYNYDPSVSKIHAWILKNKEEFHNLSEFTKEVLELDTYSKDYTRDGVKHPAGSVKMSSLASNVLLNSIIGTLVDHNMNHLVYPGTGKFLGWNSWKRYINNCSPFHLRGGVSRSNIWATRFARFIHAYGEERGVLFYNPKSKGEKGKKVWIKSSEFTPEQRRVFQEGKAEFRTVLKEIYLFLVDLLENE